MSAKNLEERITSLEEGLFFQERLLHDLNTALIGQQAQLGVMRSLLDTLKGKVLDLSDQMAEGGGPVNAKPPHYS